MTWWKFNFLGVSYAFLNQAVSSSRLFVPTLLVGSRLKHNFGQALPTSFSPKELVSQNSSLPRFAPVGLLMSKCFQLQHTQPQTTNSIRLDCVTCHDPHRPTKTDPDHYNKSCRQCHSEDDASLIHCSRESLKSNCIGCHMPKVSVNAPAMFTDHWIRVREP